MNKSHPYFSVKVLMATDVHPCQHCENESVLAYDYWGKIKNPDLANDPDLAREEPEINSACINCMLGGNIFRPEKEWVLKLISNQNLDKNKILKSFDSLPEMLGVHGFDWALCCNDWCQFNGTPATSEELVQWVRDAHYWENGIGCNSREFERDGPPESLSEVKFFKCQSCRKKYWIDWCS